MPTGGAAPRFAPQGAESPLAQLRHPGRADTLKRRRKVRDEILGRDRQLSQSPSRKGRRQTLYSCLVRPARGVDASLQKHSLAAVSRASSSNEHEKNWIIQSASGVRPLDFRDHIAVRRRLSWARSPMAMKHKDCEERNEPATLTEPGLAAIQSPRKANGLSHCIFECLIVEASSRAQNHVSVLADRDTQRCRGVFDGAGDG